MHLVMSTWMYGCESSTSAGSATPRGVTPASRIAAVTRSWPPSGKRSASISRIPCRPASSAGVRVASSMPSWTAVVHAGTGFGSPRTSTRHNRHAPAGATRGSWHSAGSFVPARSRTSRTLRPASTSSTRPSIVTRAMQLLLMPTFERSGATRVAPLPPAIAVRALDNASKHSICSPAMRLHRASNTRAPSDRYELRGCGACRDARCESCVFVRSSATTFGARLAGRTSPSMSPGVSTPPESAFRGRPPPTACAKYANCMWHRLWSNAEHASPRLCPPSRLGLHGIHLQRQRRWRRR